jgi:peptidoglycan/LPS O-acetylase OafA/YrhL
MATKTVYKVCAVALCVEIVLRAILGAYLGFGPWIFLLTFTRADGLFVGPTLAALLATRHQLSKRFLAGFAIAGSLALLVVALAGRSQILYGGPLMCTIGFSGLAILCGVLIAFCLQFEATPAARFFRLGPMRSFGKYSYGLYVFTFRSTICWIISLRSDSASSFRRPSCTPFPIWDCSRRFLRGCMAQL